MADELIRLLSVRLTRDGESHVLAIDAPAGWDRSGTYVDLGPCLRDAFGGGVQATDGADLELRVRWVTPPPLDEPDEPE